MTRERSAPPRVEGRDASHGISRVQWELLLTEYRLTPGQHTRVAKATGVGRRTAVRYWHEGRDDPRAPWACTPIKTVLDAESLELRAELALDRELAERGLATRLGELDALRARADRTMERVTNVELVRVLKHEVIEIAGAVAKVLEGLSGPTGDVLRRIFDSEAFADLCLKSPEQALRQIRQVVKIVKEIGQVAAELVKLERLLLGESTENKAVAVTHQFESTQDAIDTIERAAAAARRSQGVIDVPALERAADRAVGS